MNLFEFLLVIVSIVLGLGIGELLGGLVRILRGDLAPGWLHSLWMLIVFQLQVQLAWALWGLRAREQWLYPEFLLLLLAPMLLYLTAAVLFPAAASNENLDIHLLRRRRPFFLLIASYVVETDLFGWLLLDERWILGAQLMRLMAFVALGVLAITRNRPLHFALGFLILGSQLWFTYMFTFVVGAAPASP